MPGCHLILRANLCEFSPLFLCLPQTGWGPTSDQETIQGSDLLHPKPRKPTSPLHSISREPQPKRQPEVWGLTCHPLPRQFPLLGLQGTYLQAQPYAFRGAHVNWTSG